jgi:hypothetical protein
VSYVRRLLCWLRGGHVYIPWSPVIDVYLTTNWTDADGLTYMQTATTSTQASEIRYCQRCSWGYARRAAVFTP